MQTKQVVATETAVVHSSVKREGNGCCVGLSAGEIQSARPTITLCLHVSAVSLTGSIRKCLAVVRLSCTVECIYVQQQ